MKNIKEITLKEKLRMYRYCLAENRKTYKTIYDCIDEWCDRNGYVTPMNYLSCVQEGLEELHIYKKFMRYSGCQKTDQDTRVEILRTIVSNIRHQILEHEYAVVVKKINNLTTQEKIEMYEFCLERANTDKYYVCNSIFHWLSERNMIYECFSIDFHPDVFSEFLTYKPQVVTCDSWFLNNHHRIAALKNIISKLKSKLEDKTPALKLTLDEAKELLKTNNSLKDKIIAIYPELENKVISRWDDLKQVKGYFVSSQSETTHASQPCCTGFEENKNICATEAQAASQLAYSQLTQLIQATGKGVTEEDWKDANKEKFCVGFNAVNESLVPVHCLFSFEFIAFTCKDTRDKFMRLYAELLLQYFKAY